MLLVVPLSKDDAGSLTLEEWDRLTQRPRVLFEHDDHPLADRLREHNIDTDVVSAKPPVEDDAALVVDPTSPWLIELARDGADVTSGIVRVPDALTAAHGAYLTRSGSAALGSLALVMARLRSDDGCPWDQEQSHESLRVHLVEEAYEVLDAIDRGEVGAELEEELGDLLLQVAFHAQLAADDGRFDLAGVANGIVAKLIHRHPHVFGDTSVSGADEVVRNWESIKADEKERSGPLDGIPAGLPALLAAAKVQKRAAALGFQPSESEARDRLKAVVEGDDFDPGEALFWTVAVCRSLGIDPEGALRRTFAEFRMGMEN